MFYIVTEIYQHIVTLVRIGPKTTTLQVNAFVHTCTHDWSSS
jgi:hypothetical protein